jgi:hypothetical protein
VSNFNTLRHQFESGKTQKTAGRRLSVAIGHTKVTIAITIIQVYEMFYSKLQRDQQRLSLLSMKQLKNIGVLT